MSLLNNNNKKRDSKKNLPSGGKSNFIPQKGKANSKAAAKTTRISNRAQRGS